ncbi:hypothetical protein NEOC84_001934|nr:hypothetical protein [Neochlamydia sp. AcF84]
MSEDLSYTGININYKEGKAKDREWGPFLALLFLKNVEGRAKKNIIILEFIYEF